MLDAIVNYGFWIIMAVYFLVIAISAILSILTVIEF